MESISLKLRPGEFNDLSLTNLSATMNDQVKPLKGLLLSRSPSGVTTAPANPASGGAAS